MAYNPKGFGYVFKPTFKREGKEKMNMTWWDKKREKIYKEDLSNGKSLFVVDEPSDEDQFGFDHYVNSLEAIVRECKTPFVVGILGKWGVGKTTLINKFLRKRLNEQKNIGFVYFDAWKYQKNAFYRQFLKKMKDDLSISDDTLFVRLYKTLKKVKQSDDLEWNKEEIKNLIIELTAWYVLWLILAFQLELSVSSLWQFILPLIPSAILAFVHRGTRLLRIREHEEEDKPLFSNEQFEEVFETYVKKALSERPNGKIVIVIDNLDRCTNEVAVGLLGTIKTFLNVSGCVYIVPVDEDALINHLKEGLLNRELSTLECDKQSREFLKKFFQVTIRLAPFIRGDLEAYIDDISTEVAIPYKDKVEKENVANLVLTAYSHTPRKIKQFYNNLSASYLLALTQEEQGNIDEGFITKNLSFLAKLIIIQEEWPKFFEYLKQDPDILNLTEGSLRGKEFKSPLAGGVNIILKNDPELKEFLQSSRPYSTPDIEQFINLKRQGYGGSASESSELATSLITGKSQEAITILKEGDNNAKNSLIKMFGDKLDEKQRQGKAAAVSNILLVIEEIFPAVPEKQKDKVANLFATYLSRNTQSTNIQEFSPNGLLKILSKVTSQHKNDRGIILNEHVKKIDKDMEEVFEYLNSGYGEYVAIVPTTAKKALSKALEGAYGSNKDDESEVSYVADVLDSLRQLSEHEGALNEYLTPGLTDTLLADIRTIKHTPLDKLQLENLDILKKVIPILRENKFKTLLANIRYVLLEVPGWGEGKEKVTEFSNEVVLGDMVPQTLTQEIAEHYSNYLTSSQVQLSYHVNLLPAVKKLTEVSKEAKQQFTETFKTLISSQSVQHLVDILTKVEEQKINFREKLISPLVEKINQTADKTERESLFGIVEAFGALQNGQLYVSALKDIVITSTNFEITNHALSKLEANRPTIQDAHLNAMVPKLLEWSLGLANDPKRNTPFRFLVPSFKELTNENKEKLIDAWSSTLEKSGEPIDVKTEISGFIQSEGVVNNFPSTRKDGLPRKLLDTARATGIDEKELLLKTLVAIKPLFSRKTTFIKEMREYGNELQQQPEDTREHKIGTLFLEGLN